MEIHQMAPSSEERFGNNRKKSLLTLRPLLAFSSELKHQLDKTILKINSISSHTLNNPAQFLVFLSIALIIILPSLTQLFLYTTEHSVMKYPTLPTNYRPILIIDKKNTIAEKGEGHDNMSSL